MSVKEVQHPPHEVWLTMPIDIMYNMSMERILYERCRDAAFWKVQCFGVQRFDPALLCDCVLPDGGPSVPMSSPL